MPRTAKPPLIRNIQFDRGGNPTQDIVYNSDGSKTISQYLITGQAYTSSKVDFNAAGVAVSIIDYYSNGQIQYQQQKFLDFGRLHGKQDLHQRWRDLELAIVNPDGTRNQSVYATDATI